jgi:TonB family protein
MIRPLFALSSAFLLAAAAPPDGQDCSAASAPMPCGYGIATNSPPPAMPRGEIAVYRAPATIQAGTPVVLRLIEDMSIKRVGDRVLLEVAEPVMSGGLPLLPGGSGVIGEITRLRMKPGRNGGLAIRLLHARAYRMEIRLKGQASATLPLGELVNGVIDEALVPPQLLVPVYRDVPSRPAAAPGRYSSPGAAAAPTPSIIRPAQPRHDPAAYVSIADYPAAAIQAQEEGIVRFTLDVGVHGRVTGCTITQSSGSSALDSASCRLMRSRARFTPAVDSSGNPAASRVHQQLTWTLPVAK